MWPNGAIYSVIAQCAIAPDRATTCSLGATNCKPQTVNCKLQTHFANLYLRFPLLTFATNRLIPANQQRKTTGRIGTWERVITPSNSKVNAQAFAREKVQRNAHSATVRP